MNINPEFFNELSNKCSNNDEILSSSLRDIKDIIYGDLDNRLMKNEKKELLYEIQNDLNNLSISNEELKTVSRRGYISITDNSHPPIDMKVNPATGVSWATENSAKIEASMKDVDANNSEEYYDSEVIFSVYPEFKDYINKLEEKNPFLKNLTEEGKKKYINEAFKIFMAKGINSNYYTNRDEILKTKSEYIKFLNSYNIAIDVDIQSSWSPEHRAKAKELINKGESYLIEYYNKYNLLRNKDKLTESEQNEYDYLDENVIFMGELAYNKKLKEDELKKFGINSIALVDELESNYQECLTVENSFVYDYVKDTKNYDAFLTNCNGDYWDSNAHNGFREYSKFATNEQRATYDYLYENYGKAAADNYYKVKLEDNYIFSKGADEAYVYLSNIENKNLFVQSALSIWEGAQDGVEADVRNTINLFSPSGKMSSDDVKRQIIIKAFEGKVLVDSLGEEKAIEVMKKLNSGEYTQQDVIDILKKEGKDYNSVLDGYVFPDDKTKNMVLKTLYSTGVVVGNMLPTIVTGRLATALLKGTALATLPIGGILIGLSSAGGARNSALIEGYSPGTALIYSLLTGASTAILEYYLSPFEGIGKNPVGFSPKTLLGVLKSYGKSIVQNTVEEVIEDSVQIQLIDRIGLNKTVTLDEFAASSWETAKMAIAVSILMGSGELTLSLGDIALEKGGKAVKYTATHIAQLAEIFKIPDLLLRNQKLIELNGTTGIVANPELFNLNRKSQLDIIMEKTKSNILSFKNLFRNVGYYSMDIKDIIIAFNQKSYNEKIEYIKNSDASTINCLFSDVDIYKNHKKEINNKIIEFQDILFGVIDFKIDTKNIINNETILNNLSNSNLLTLISESKNNVTELVIKEIEKRLSQGINIFSEPPKTTHPSLSTYNSVKYGFYNLPVELRNRVQDFFSNNEIHPTVQALVKKYPNFNFFQQHLLSRLIQEGKIDSTGIDALNRLIKEHPDNLTTFNFEVLNSKIISVLGIDYVLEAGKYDYMSFELMSLFNNQDQSLLGSFAKIINDSKLDDSLNTYYTKNRKLLNFFFLNKNSLESLNPKLLIEPSFIDYALRFYSGGRTIVKYLDIDYSENFEVAFAKHCDGLFSETADSYFNEVKSLSSEKYLEEQINQIINYYKGRGILESVIEEKMDIIIRQARDQINVQIDNIKTSKVNDTLEKLKNIYYQKYFSMTYDEAKAFVLKFGTDIEQVSKHLSSNSVLTVLNTFKHINNLSDIDQLKNIYASQQLSFNAEEMLYIDKLATDGYTNSYEQQLLDTDKNVKSVIETGKTKIIDYNGSQVVVVEAPDSFSFFVHSSDTGYVVNKKLVNDSFIDTWNIDHNPKTHSLSTSFITQSNIGSAPVLGNGVLYAFSNVSAENISAMGTTDINSHIADYGFSSGTKQEFYSPQNISQQTLRAYNEFVIDRSSSKPDYIILYLDSTEQGKQNAYKAASEWGIPIIQVDKLKLAESQRVIINEMIDTFKEDQNVEVLDKALKLFEANTTGYGLNSSFINTASTLSSGKALDTVSQIFNPSAIEKTIDVFINNNQNSKNTQNLKELLSVLKQIQETYVKANEMGNQKVPNSTSLINYDTLIKKIESIIKGE